MTALVSLRGLRRSFGSRTVFSNLDLDLSPGVTGILGPNGAGKTTLLRCIATALDPDEGEIRIAGRDCHEASDRAAVRRRIGYLPQSPGFFPHFSVEEIVDYIAILKLISNSAERAAEVTRVLDLVELSDRRKTKVRKLSGGMRQRLGIAQALLGQPEVLVLDEPTTGLDPEQRIHFRSLISRIGESAVVVLSTHQTEDVAALCERVVVFTGGVVAFDGAPSDVAGLAAGKVWLSTERPQDSAPSWRTADGRYRSIGERPPAGEPASVGVEDGYLLLLARDTGRRP